MNNETYCKVIENIMNYPDNHFILNFDDIEEEDFPRVCHIMRRLQNDLPIRIELHSQINIENGYFEVALKIEKE